MDSAERRDEVLRLLRRRSDWTADHLADAVGVSRRTVLRDIQTLRERGFDISAMSGPGGGFHLEASSVAITSHLDAAEVIALILAVAIAEATSWTPFSASAQSALSKIEAALPSRRVTELQTVMQRVLVDPAKLSDDVQGYDIDQDLVGLFEQAFTSEQLLEFCYIDRKGRKTQRQVEPHGLLIRAPLWYVVAWDPGKDGPRLFRADRIRQPQVIDIHFVPRPHELVTGVCPDAKPVVAPRKPRSETERTESVRTETGAAE